MIVAMPKQMNISIIDIPMNPYYTHISSPDLLLTKKAKNSFLELAAVQPIEAVTRRVKPHIIIVIEMNSL
jgi:hypothetical protein